MIICMLSHLRMKDIEAGKFNKFRKILKKGQFDSVLLTEYRSLNSDWPGQLLRALGNTAITSLHLTHNNMGYVEIAALAKHLVSAPNLTKLDLSHNSLDNKAVAEIARALPQVQNLTTLFLDHNNISAQEAKYFLEALPKSKLTTFVYSFSIVIDPQIKLLIKQYLDFNQRKADLLRYRQQSVVDYPQFPLMMANASSNNNNLLATPSKVLKFSTEKNKKQQAEMESPICDIDLNDAFWKKISLSKKPKKNSEPTPKNPRPGKK